MSTYYSTLLNTCPYHFNLLSSAICLDISPTFAVPHNSCISYSLQLGGSLIHLNSCIIISATSNLLIIYCSLFNDHVLAPCIIASLTTVLYTFPWPRAYSSVTHKPQYPLPIFHPCININVLSSVVSCGCETWTYSKAIDHKINAFEMWCYRRMLIIIWTSHTTNIDVLQQIGVKEITMLNNLKNRKLSYAGHIMRNTSGYYDTLMTTIEGRLEGKRGRGRPRRTWVDDIREWTGSKRYDQRELQNIETYMGHLQPTAVDATSNESISI